MGSNKGDKEQGDSQKLGSPIKYFLVLVIILFASGCR